MKHTLTNTLKPSETNPQIYEQNSKNNTFLIHTVTILHRHKHTRKRFTRFDSFTQITHILVNYTFTHLKIFEITETCVVVLSQ